MFLPTYREMAPRRTPRRALRQSCRVAALALAAAASLVLTSPTYAIDTNFQYEINPQHNFGKCLDVQGGSTANSTHLIQYDCHHGPNQRFRFERIFGNLYEIRAVHSDKCLDIQGGSIESGAHLIQYDCHGGPNQLFKVVNDTTAAGFTSQLSVVQGNKCLAVQGASDANSAHVIQLTCRGTASHQKFDGIAFDDDDVN